MLRMGSRLGHDWGDKPEVSALWAELSQMSSEALAQRAQQMGIVDKSDSVDSEQATARIVAEWELQMRRARRDGDFLLPSYDSMDTENGGNADWKRADRELVLAAITKGRSPYVLQFASSALRADRRLVLVAVEHGLQFTTGEPGWRYAQFGHVGGELWADKTFVLTLLETIQQAAAKAADQPRGYEILRGVAAEVRQDPEVFAVAKASLLECIVYTECCLHFGTAATELLADREVLLVAVATAATVSDDHLQELFYDSDLSKARKEHITAILDQFPEAQQADLVVQRLAALKNSERALPRELLRLKLFGHLQHVPKMLDEGITVELLPSLHDEHLQKLGMATIGERVTFMEAVKGLGPMERRIYITKGVAILVGNTYEDGAVPVPGVATAVKKAEEVLKGFGWEVYNLGCVDGGRALTDSIDDIIADKVPAKDSEGAKDGLLFLAHGHGDERSFDGNDGISTRYDQIIAKLDHSKFTNKPKIAIFDCCYGHAEPAFDTVQLGETKDVCQRSDILICRPVGKGFAATAHGDGGVYTNMLMDEFKKRARCWDVKRMISLVHDDFHQRTGDGGAAHLEDYWGFYTVWLAGPPEGEAGAWKLEPEPEPEPEPDSE
jgi:hypothetical protein